jgi:predicted RNA-binding Zn ribbon-like protein
MQDEMERTKRIPQPVHAEDPVPAAPGDLELVRRFLSLHDHEIGSTEGFAPSPETIEWWLRTEAGLGSDVDIAPRDLEWAMRIREALVTKVQENMGVPRDPEAVALLNEAATETGLRLCFGCTDDGRLHTETDGVRGTVGRLLGATFLAELEGSWHRFRLCADPTCNTVFYDRSKNHSAKWCSMQSCGNRNKVRAFRERHATAR